MLVQLTEKWINTWIDMLSFYKEIYDICKQAGYKTIWDVMINKTVADIIFIDPDTWWNYSDEEQKKIKKSMIHNFVGMRDYFPKIFGTDNIDKIIKIMEKNIKKLQKMENLPS